MVIKHIQRALTEKSKKHREALQELGKEALEEPPSKNLHVLKQSPQLLGMSTIIQDQETSREDFIFYFDRLATLLVERYAILK
jgi:uridine kinase